MGFAQLPRTLPMQRKTPLVLVSVVFGFFAAAASTACFAADAVASGAEPGLHGCPGAAQVFVRAAAAADAETVCEGVDRVLRFLARAGLPPPPGTTVELVQQLPAELGERALGCYLRETGTVQLLTYGKFETGGDWFRMQRDRELYRALASHEMAHAVVGCHSAPGKLPIPAHEYVAYVAMFATMDPETRERLLAKFPGSGFTSTLQINDINYLVDPNSFGAESWRHYLKRRDREAWLREVVSGLVVQTWPIDGP